jgi:hypothetical protein
MNGRLKKCLIAVLILSLLAVIALPFVLSEDKGSTGDPSPSESGQPYASEECIDNALTAYMHDLGSADNEFVIGESNVNWDDPTLRRAGEDSVGDLAESREELGAVFLSSDETDRAIVSNLTDEFPNYPQDVVLSPRNWGVVQTLVDLTIADNTAMINGNITGIGDTAAPAGDAMWLLVDPVTCTVVMSEDGASVAAIRPGCSNPTNGWEKNPALDPAPRSNAPEGRDRSQDPGSGEYIPPSDMEQPSATPRENTPTPSPSTPPLGSTPDPAPTPSPEPSAAPPDDPVSPDEGDGCPPGGCPTE